MSQTETCPFCGTHVVATAVICPSCNAFKAKSFNNKKGRAVGGAELFFMPLTILFPMLILYGCIRFFMFLFGTTSVPVDDLPFGLEYVHLAFPWPMSIPLGVVEIGFFTIWAVASVFAWYGAFRKPRWYRRRP